MQKPYKVYFISLLVLVTLLANGISISMALAKGQGHSVTSINNPTTSAKPASASLVAMHIVNMTAVPEASPSPSPHSKQLPLLTGVSAAEYAQRKAAAAHNKNTPSASVVYPMPKVDNVNTPTATTRFQGQGDTCGGCQPPDQALAASPSWVFQGVNDSYAVYTTSGTLQSGWPKTAQSFFGIPSPGACSPAGQAFVADPRAFYDINDGRFWAAILEVEGAFGVNSCPFATRFWIAVSQTSDPRGAWNIYAFDMSGGTTNAADFTQIGFDAQALYFSGNMFNQAGTAYQYAEIFAASKASMESGSSVMAHGFSSLSAGGVLVDTVQPVETEAHSYSGPVAGLFINSFNINGDPFGDNCFSTACHGLMVWSITNPTSSTPGLSSFLAPSANYILAPMADEPGCTQCIETSDTRISGTPVYHDDLLTFALETGKSNSTQIVPSIFWGQVRLVLDLSGNVTGVFTYQSSYLVENGDLSASFGALMPDDDGNLFMVFDLMGSSVNPEIAYVARRITFNIAHLPDGGKVLRVGDARTNNSRWGDYEATSYDGFSSDNVWFSSQYSNASGDWSTYVGEDKFTLTS